MKKLNGCQYEQKIRSRSPLNGQDKDLERHIDNCPECRESKKVFEWMQRLAVQPSRPQNLPAPGFLLFKSQLIKKQSATRRAVQPIVWAQTTSTLILVLAIVYLQLKSRMPVTEFQKEIFASFSSIALLIVSGSIAAALICAGFAYFLRNGKRVTSRG